jgi:hypothetical protein
MSIIRVWGADAGDFVDGRVIWSALNALAPAKRSPPTHVDLTDLVMIRPYTATAVAALGAMGRRTSSLNLPLTHEARDYVVRSGLSEFFAGGEDAALSPSLRSVPVRQLQAVPGRFADELTQAWEREFQGMPVGLRVTLADHIDEMIRNALAHSESEIGCIVAAQVYPTRRVVEVSILDLGQTIRGHLSRLGAYSALRDDAEAILLATREGITGTPPGTLNKLGEPNSGVGLFELRRYCENGGGECAVASGDAIVVFGRGSDPITRRFAGGFPGCLINIQFVA